MIFVHNDRFRTVQIDIQMYAYLSNQFEHLLIENRLNGRLGYRLG